MSGYSQRVDTEPGRELHPLLRPRWNSEAAEPRTEQAWDEMVAAVRRRHTSTNHPLLREIFFPMDEHLFSTLDFDIDDIEKVARKLSKRQRVVAFIDKPSVQTFLLCLLLVDVACVISEILIAAHKEATVVVVPRDGTIGPCAAGNLTALADNYFAVDPGCAFRVDLLLSHDLHLIELVLRNVSFGVSLVFLLELLILMACLLCKFFTVMNLLDAAIIITSIVMQFTVSEDTETEISLIIFLRCWRFARILHGVGLTVHDHAVQHAEHLARQAEARYRKQCEELEQWQRKAAAHLSQRSMVEAETDGAPLLPLHT